LKIPKIKQLADPHLVGKRRRRPKIINNLKLAKKYLSIATKKKSRKLLKIVTIRIKCKFLGTPRSKRIYVNKVKARGGNSKGRQNKRVCFQPQRKKLMGYNKKKENPFCVIFTHLYQNQFVKMEPPTHSSSSWVEKIQRFLHFETLSALGKDFFFQWRK